MAGMFGASSSSSSVTMSQELEGGLEVLEADLAELENSVYHLVRSNVELAQFLDEAPGDKDLEEALEENKVVLVKKRHRVKALRNAISDLKAYSPHLTDATAPTATIKTPPSATGVGTASGGGGARIFGISSDFEAAGGVGGGVAFAHSAGSASVVSEDRGGVAPSGISTMTAEMSLDEPASAPGDESAATGDAAHSASSRQPSGRNISQTSERAEEEKKEENVAGGGVVGGETEARNFEGADAGRVGDRDDRGGVML